MKHRRKDSSSSSSKSKVKKKKCNHQNNNNNLTTLIQQSSATVPVLFGVLLAALFHQQQQQQQQRSCSNCSLIKLCLNKLRLVLFSTCSQQQTLPIPVLSLLPPILSSKCAEIVRCGAEFVGMASLYSYQMNQQIALDSLSPFALLSALRNSHSAAALLASSNALLDLSATHVARRRFIHFSALPTLMLKFLQLPKVSDPSVSFHSITDDEDITRARIALNENELPLLLLHAASILVTSSHIERLKIIPRKLSQPFFLYLKELWGKVRHQMCVAPSSQATKRHNFYSSNLRICDLAENIFRLSAVVDSSHLSETLPFDKLKNGIFGTGGSSFKDFMLNSWETSPFILDRVSRFSTLEDDIFHPFLQALGSKPGDPYFISTMLQGMVSCLPISSDDLDISSFLEEFGGGLGCPLIYQQDIRVLKTERKSKSEVHYFHERSGASPPKNPLYLSNDNIMKCEEAFKEGYTVALRGVEFRFSSVAAIADALAAVFGQPSAGANLYLTPPSSQGLMRHYDDHCVFVCQLFGTKRWSLYSVPGLRHLPRLYEPLDPYFSGAETSMSESKQVLLREGGILYIPRGVPHEACTSSGEDEESSGCSLHLTLGIEVEPPFEWEGFTHVALHCWVMSQKQSDDDAADSSSAILDIIAVNLMHVVINFISESNPTFRKACLAASSLPSDANYCLQPSQKIIFSHMVEKINGISSISDVVCALKLSARKKVNPLYQIRWLQHLHSEGEDSMKCYCTTLMSTEKLLDICSQSVYKAETTFLQMKYNFGKVVLFDNVVDKYKSLLERYRKVRKQYMNGMLSLHRN